MRLSPEGLPRCWKQLRARYEIHLASFEECRGDRRRHPQTAARQEYGRNFQEHVLEQEGTPPLTGHESLHRACGRVVVEVTRVVVGDEEARVEDDHG